MLWRNGIEELSPSDIIDAFDSNLDDETSEELQRLYGISHNRPTASRLGALDFLNDQRYATPISRIVEKWKDHQNVGSSKQVYRYLFDQSNPWQPSSRAHHAVDLIYLFGGYDDCLERFYHDPTSLDPPYWYFAIHLFSSEMRASWIQFINGEEPWEDAKNLDWSFGTGFHGDTLSQKFSDWATRRRASQIKLLKNFEDYAALERVAGALAAGRLSFLN